MTIRRQFADLLEKQIKTESLKHISVPARVEYLTCLMEKMLDNVGKYSTHEASGNEINWHKLSETIVVQISPL